MPQTVALAVSFNSKIETNPKDILATKQYGWEIAGREAYPTIYRKEPGCRSDRLSPGELELLEASMRAPGFSGRRRPDDPGPYHTSVAVASGQSDLVLSWAAAE